MPDLPRIPRDTPVRQSRLRLEGDERSPTNAIGNLEQTEATKPKGHPVLSFLRVLRGRFGDPVKEQSQVQLIERRDNQGGKDDAGDASDDAFLRIEFSTVDDVIEFYRNHEDCEEEWSEGETGISELEGERGDFFDPNQNRETKAASGEIFEQDAVVSSWIDNCHFLLAEQQKRERQRKKQVRFETEGAAIDPPPSSSLDENDDDGADDNDDDGDDGNCDPFSADNIDEEDDLSLVSSSCSTSTESTWHSMDTIEQQEFEEFATRWNAQGIHGKNTEKSLWRRLLREVLVGPSDEDFEIQGDADGKDALYPVEDTIVFEEKCESQSDDASATRDRSNDDNDVQHPLGGDGGITTEIEMREFFFHGDPHAPENDNLPSDLLFSIDSQ